MADLTPNNREEYWLQGMVDGQTTLEPNTRREYWYKEIVDAIGSGGGGGTGGGGLVCHIGDNDALDKTWKEIHDALNAGTPVTVAGCSRQPEYNGIFAFCTGTLMSNGTYSLFVAYIVLEEGSTGAINIETLTTDSANGYPAFE